MCKPYALLSGITKKSEQPVDGRTEGVKTCYHITQTELELQLYNGHSRVGNLILRVLAIQESD